jgi:WD40 repeat protein
VNHAGFSPDGKRIVTASADKTAKVWDATSGKLLVSLEGHTDSVKSAAFSPDGRRIVTVSGYTARVWDADSGKLLASLEEAGGMIVFAVFSPDGGRIVTGVDPDYARVLTYESRRLVTLWDVASGKKLWFVSIDDFPTGGGPDKAMYAAVFSPDGRRIFTTSNSGMLYVWDTADGKLLTSNQYHRGQNRRGQPAAFSNDGRHVVMSDFNNIMYVWDTDSGKPVAYLEGRDFGSHAAFSPDGMRIVIQGGALKIWDTKSGRLLASFDNYATAQSATFSHDGARIVMANLDGTVKVIDVHLETRSPKEIAEIVEQRVPIRFEQGRLIPRKGILIGIVVDAENNSPLPDVVVEIVRNGSDEKLQRRTDSNGKFRFESLEPGRYDVTARKKGYKSNTIKDIIVPLGVITPLTTPPLMLEKEK